MKSRPITLCTVTLSAALVCGALPAGAEVRMTELKVANDPQVVEIFNSGPVVVDLTGWVIKNQSKTSVTTLSGTIGVNAFRTFDVEGFIEKRGDILELFDPALESLLDRVRFGYAGGAPIDVASVPTSSISRAAGTADPSGLSSATNWTVDFTATLGGANNVPAPIFDRVLLINEIVPQGGTIRAELFNNSAGSINLNGYRLTTGVGQLILSGVVGPGGFATFDITPLNFEFSLNLYLFRADEVRIDQLGLSNSPGNQTTWLSVKNAGDSIGRCPNGAGPQIGFDLPSSGFPTSLRVMAPTLGATNGCSTGGGGDSNHVPIRWPALVASGLACWAIARSVLRRRAGNGLAGGGPRG